MLPPAPDDYLTSRRSGRRRGSGALASHAGIGGGESVEDVIVGWIADATPTVEAGTW